MICVFFLGQIRTLVAIATSIFHILIMGKVIDNIFLSQWGIFGIYFLFLQNRLLSSPLRFIWLLSKSLNLIGCQGNKKG